MRFLLIFLVLILTTPAYSASQICSEDFEGVTVGAIPQYDPTGSGEIDIAGRPFYGTEGSGDDGAFVEGAVCSGGSGKCARAYVQSIYINGNSYNSPKFLKV